MGDAYDPKELFAFDVEPYRTNQHDFSEYKERNMSKSEERDY